MSAQWYCSATKYALIAQWQVSHAYTLGAFVRRLTGGTQNNLSVFRCTSAGTSGATEPTWNTNVAATTTDGGVTWTEVTGNSTYGWGAAAGDLGTLTGVGVQAHVNNAGSSSGDTVFIDSTQAETGVDPNLINSTATNIASVSLISVNTGGSVPPVQADYTPGASFSTSQTLNWGNSINSYGCNWTIGATSGGHLFLGATTTGDVHIQDGVLTCVAYGNNYFIGLNQNNASRVRLRNVKVSVPSGITYVITGGTQVNFTWEDSSDPFNGATNFIYVILAQDSSNYYFRGVDLSRLTGSVYLVQEGNFARTYIHLDGCIFSPAQITATYPPSAPGAYVTYNNCDTTANNTNYNSGAANTCGFVTTDASVTMVAGSSIEGTLISHKLVGATTTGSQSASDPAEAGEGLEGFLEALDNSLTGALHTLTVQLLGATQLQNTDVELEVFYLSSTTSSIISRVSSLPLIPVGAALSAGSGTWNNAPGGSFVQQISVSFTPQKAGLVSWRIRLHNAVTCWVNRAAVIT